MESQSLAGRPRLLLEPLHPDHAHGLFDALADPRVYEHICDAPAESVPELASQFSRMAQGPPADHAGERWLNVAIRRREDWCLLGRLQATIIDQRAEVAYLIGPRFWGQGFAIEGMSAFQRHLKDHEGVSEFWATTTPQNSKSIRLLERLQYRRVFEAWPPLLSYDDGDLVFVLR